MTTDKREEAFRQALKTALGELVEEEWDAMAALQVEHPASRRCRARMRQVLSGRSESRKPRRIMKKIGIGILVALASFSLLGMTIEEVRTAFGNAVVTWYRNYFNVEIKREDAASYPLRIFTPNEPSVLPDGLTETVRKQIFEHELEISYADAGGNRKLNYRQSVIRPYSSLWIDAEAKIAEVTVNGWHGMFFYYDEPDRRNALTWEDGVYQYDLIGPYEKEELLRIAESVGPICPVDQAEGGQS